MNEQEKPLDLRRLVLGAIGASLLTGGLVVAIWAVTVINDALYAPADIPLLQSITETLDQEAGALEITSDDGGFAVRGANVVFLILLVGFLFVALGGIVQALISGGVNLLGDATWRESKRRRDRGADR